MSDKNKNNQEQLENMLYQVNDYNVKDVLRRFGIEKPNLTDEQKADLRNLVESVQKMANDFVANTRKPKKK